MIIVRTGQALPGLADICGQVLRTRPWGSWLVRQSAARGLALCSRRLRGAPNDAGVASGPAPAGIDVFRLNAAALRRTADPAASSAVIHVTPAEKRPPMAQPGGRKPQMAQTRWQRLIFAGKGQYASRYVRLIRFPF